MKLRDRLKVHPNAKIHLGDWDPDDACGFPGKAEAKKMLEENRERLSDLQHLLYASNKWSVLVILQALDAAGKDGTIRDVFSSMNPQGVKVTPFKAPSAEELDHDFLWRIHKAVPGKGEIGVFNRSHYEDVLVVRVRNLVPEKVWSKRYEQINQFEEILAQNDVKIIKFFLHISKEEQLERLKERLERPDKNWKVDPKDFEERKRWDDYVKAFEEALSRCSTERAPWFIVPSNRKWVRNLAVSQILMETLEGLEMKYPPPACDLSKIVIG